MPVHRAGWYAQHSRRFEFVATALFYGRPHQSFRRFIHGRADGDGNIRFRSGYPCRFPGPGWRWRKRETPDCFAIREGHGPLDDMGQFPDVAGPGMRQQLIQRGRRDGTNIAAHFHGIHPEEVAGEHGMSSSRSRNGGKKICTVLIR